MKDFCIFYHIAVMDGWEDSYDIINSYLINSRIIDSCDKIFYCVNGDYEKVAERIDIFSVKQALVHLRDDFSHFEFPTINFLHDYLNSYDTKALYIHSKCASHANILEVGYCAYWLDTMCYYNISKFVENAELLDIYDAVGSGYCIEPWCHFSGNFWWSKSSHIRKLNNLIFGYENFKHNEAFGQRHDAERWVCSKSGLFHNLGDVYYGSKFMDMYKIWETNRAPAPRHS